MNEITRDNIGEWIGKEVEVSHAGEDWMRRQLIGLHGSDFVVLSKGYEEWKFCRPLQPKYRTPTIADWGKECEFWDFNFESRVTLILCGVIPESEYGFVAADGKRYRNAQIEDKL